jgi:hypothetical protein
MSFPAVYSGTPATIAPENARAMRVLLDGASASSVDVAYENLPSVRTLQGAGVTVSPSAMQAAGIDIGTITISVRYTGS